jgi:hypothetical protein
MEAAETAVGRTALVVAAAPIGIAATGVCTKILTFHKMSSHPQISEFSEYMSHLGISTTQRRKLFTFLADKTCTSNS